MVRASHFLCDYRGARDFQGTLEGLDALNEVDADRWLVAIGWTPDSIASFIFCMFCVLGALSNKQDRTIQCGGKLLTKHFVPPPSITAIGFLPHSNTASAASRAVCSPRWVKLKSSTPDKQC